MSDPLINAFHTGLKHAPESGPPVNMDRILDALTHASNTDEVAEVVDLTITHASWAAAWAEARQMLATSQTPPPTLYEAPTPANKPWLGVLTAFVAAAAVVLVVRAVRPSLEDPYRDGPTQIITAKIDAVSRTRASITWAPVPKDAAVKLQVFDSQLRPLHQSSGTGLSEAIVPAQHLTSVAKGQAFLWHVEITPVQGLFTRSSTFRTTLLD